MYACHYTQIRHPIHIRFTPLCYNFLLCCAGDQHIVYKVHSIQGKIFVPFEAAQGAVVAKWKQEQQSKALKNYFEKMKTRADVQILREEGK